MIEAYHRQKGALPNMDRIKDPDTRIALSAISQRLEELIGVKGRIQDRALTVGDLEGLKMVGVKRDNRTLFNPNLPDAPVFIAKIKDMPYWTGVFEAVGLGATQTVHCVGGEVMDWSGELDVIQVDVTPPVTTTLTISYGAVSPANGRFDVIDPSTGRRTMTMYVEKSRIRSVSL